MRLYFLRHAEALDGLDDAARPLSPRGCEQCRRVGHWLKRVEIRLDAAFSSPLVRARQTGELVLGAAGLDVPGGLVESSALLNGTSPTAFIRWAKTITRHEHVLLVGHEPTMSERVRRLLGMRDPEAFQLPKAALACVSTEDAQTGTLKFFVTPKVI